MAAGEILIGGKNIKDISYEALLQNISIVFQKTFLSRESVLENIRMGSDASLEEVRKAAKLAQIDDFIMSLPEAYDTKVGSFGSRFSGGEKQRIAIARAILKNAPILILDEATSAADPENQREIDLAIRNLCENKTVIIVAHRLGVVELCQKLAIVENKKVSDVGSHEEILKRNAYYQKVFKDYCSSKKVVYGREKFQIDSHEIEFENVCFSYNKETEVLKNISFHIPDGKLTAIVGSSGSGKSTILNLIAKYYEADRGKIKIGGKEIEGIAAERVLDEISMVDQDVFLFDDSIRENIRYARPEATDEEVEEAARLANCEDFVQKMEKGYETKVGENGNHLSGGERQRVSITRAILKNSPILLLDEATSSLDIENELKVKQAILNLLQENKTVVMIAHSLSIVENADQILVVDEGRIIESGRHKELLQKEGKYFFMRCCEASHYGALM